MADAKKNPIRDHSEGLNPGLIVSHSRDLDNFSKAVKEASSKLRNERKRMKENGVDLAAYDLAQSLMRLDPAEAKLRLNRAFYILGALHAPVGSQLTFQEMLDNNAPVSDVEREKRWAEEGAHAFVVGQPEHSMPHAANTPAGRAWLTGYREAEASAKAVVADAEAKAPDPFQPISDVIAPKADETPAKRGRGRPPGSGKKPPALKVVGGSDAEPKGEEPAGDLPPDPPTFDADAASDEFAAPPPEPTMTDDLPVPEFDVPPAPPAA